MRTIRDEDETSEQVELPNAKCIGATDKAIRVEVNDRVFWIPQSQVTADSEVYRIGDEGTLVVTGWFARKEGLV
jgi:hypothetical protein